MQIVLHHYVNLGTAAAIRRGLMVRNINRSGSVNRQVTASGVPSVG